MRSFLPGLALTGWLAEDEDEADRLEENFPKTFRRSGRIEFLAGRKRCRSCARCEKRDGQSLIAGFNRHEVSREMPTEEGDFLFSGPERKRQLPAFNYTRHFLRSPAFWLCSPSLPASLQPAHSSSFWSLGGASGE